MMVPSASKRPGSALRRSGTRRPRHARRILLTAASSPRLWLLASAWLLAGIGSFAATPAPAQNAPPGEGRIEGRVLSEKGRKPLPYTNLTILGTTIGAIAQDDGRFVIAGVPAGTHEIQASYIGYEVIRKEIRVESGRTTEVEFRLQETVAAREKEVLVTAERPLVDVKSASTTRSFNQEELKALTTIDPTLDAVVEQQPGVTRHGNEIHIRGGRADETLFIIDGVKMRDLLSGESQGSNISARSVAEVNIITGGFDAKYGQALSGIVEARTKEGGEEFEGFLGYTTDRANTDWNTDLWSFQIGGPFGALPGALRGIGIDEPGKATFFVDLGVDLRDDYKPTISDFEADQFARNATGDSIPAIRRHLRSEYRDGILGTRFKYGEFFYPRAINRWRLLSKLAWKASPEHKFVFSFSKNIGFDQGFGESDIADVDRNDSNYPWIWSQRLDRYHTVTRDENSLSLSWNHALSGSLVHNMTMTRYFTSRHQDVSGLFWTEYGDTLGRDSALPQELDTPYFYDLGWSSDYRDRFVQIWGIDSEWRLRRGRHDIRWGYQGEYQDVQYFSLDASTYVPPDTATGDPGRPLGEEYDLFHVYPNVGALFLQDRMEYEGLIASVGLRYDYWFPGEQVERLYDKMDRPTINEATRAEFYEDTNGLFGHRFKGHLSPRIQVSHPITDRDHLFFNYGHFTQRPAYFYVYAKTSSLSSEEFPRIGNPNLNPEISVQYELGAGHQFKEDMAGKLSLFYKDTYDYPTSTRLVIRERETRRSDFFIYQNMDYARTLGFEVELRKSRSRYLSGALAYTYSQAKGKNSDPNSLSLVQESGGDARATYLEEVYMWWNRPHKLTAWVDWRVRRGQERPRLLGWKVPEDVQLNFYWMIRSGRPYTPEDRFGNKTGQEYSENGPYDTTVNAKFVKGWTWSGQRLEITAEAFNLFNHRTPLRIDPSTGDVPKIGEGQYARIYEDPRYGVDPDYNRVVQATESSLADPSLRSAPRSIRLGLGVEW